MKRKKISSVILCGIVMSAVIYMLGTRPTVIGANSVGQFVNGMIGIGDKTSVGLVETPIPRKIFRSH